MKSGGASYDRRPAMGKCLTSPNPSRRKHTAIAGTLQGKVSDFDPFKKGVGLSSVQNKTNMLRGSHPARGSAVLTGLSQKRAFISLSSHEPFLDWGCFGVCKSP